MFRNPKQVMCVKSVRVKPRSARWIPPEAGLSLRACAYPPHHSAPRMAAQNEDLTI
jgi:hypothetical protein